MIQSVRPSSPNVPKLPKRTQAPQTYPSSPNVKLQTDKLTKLPKLPKPAQAPQTYWRCALIQDICRSIFAGCIGYSHVLTLSGCRRSPRRWRCTCLPTTSRAR